MTLEQQVCSLELAKRLQKLRVKQESLYYWCTDLNELTQSRDCRPFCKAECGEHPSAFTVAELGEMLPDRIKVQDLAFMIQTTKDLMYAPKIWSFAYAWETPWHAEHAKTEAEVRAKMLIYLLENKIIETAS